MDGQYDSVPDTMRLTNLKEFTGEEEGFIPAPQWLQAKERTDKSLWRRLHFAAGNCYKC